MNSSCPNKKVWNKLGEKNQKALQDWYYMAYADLLKALDEQDKALVARDANNPDIEVIDWPQAERDAFRKIATKAWEDTAAKSPQAREALDAHYAYMRKIGLLQ